MLRINKYFAGGCNQFRRINRAINTLNRRRSEERAFLAFHSLQQTTLQQVFLDIHYYFICWDAIKKMIEFLKAHSGFEAVSDVHKNYRRVLERYSDARNHFEHFNERLRGAKRGNRLTKPSDLGNLDGYVFTLGGDKYDVGPESLKQLDRIVSELNTRIIQAAMPRYQKMLNGVQNIKRLG